MRGDVIRVRTQVGIIGAGPAGLCIANILQQAGVDCVVLEQRSRQYVESRERAGTIEHRAVQLLRRFGLAGKLLSHGKIEDTIEFRMNGERHLIRYAAILPGGTHYIYPQQFLVRDLIAAFTAGGGRVHFDSEVVAITGLEGARPVVVARLGGREEITVECVFVAGCDGDRGISGLSMPGVTQRYEHRESYAWLAVTADAPPSAPWVVTALHEDGAALHVRRTGEVSRFYLQCDADDTVEHWPAERIWKAIRTRMATDVPQPLHEGPTRSAAIVAMRSMVREPFRYGPLLLAGDSAHIVPPVGGKGMNIALADAGDLALALVDWFRHGDEHRLDTYSERRLSQAWRAQEFVHWMMGLVNTPGLGTLDAPFLHRIQQARLGRLLASKPYAEAFIEDYVGLW